jgi:hypothetical protein
LIGEGFILAYEGRLGFKGESEFVPGTLRRSGLLSIKKKLKGEEHSEGRDYIRGVGDRMTGEKIANSMQ